MLLVGSATEIAERLATLKGMDLSTAVRMGTGGDESDFLNQTLEEKMPSWTRSSHLLAKEIFSDLDSSDLSVLQKLPPPPLPTNLSPLQAAQMEAFLQYTHLRLRHLVASVRSTPDSLPEVPADARITLSASQWQNVIDLHTRIATYMSVPMPENNG